MKNDDRTRDRVPKTRRSPVIFNQLYGVVLVATLTAGSVAAQSSRQQQASDRQPERLLSPELLGREAELSRPRVGPMEGPIDPASYILGPSDLLNIAVWGPLSISHSVPVTPEGTVIIPTVGEISVAGKRLSDAKEQIRERVKREYKVGEVTVTLLTPRSFAVTLRGAVLKEGQYVASGVDRVEKIVREGATMEQIRPSANMPISADPVGDPLREGKIELPGVRQRIDVDDNTSLRNIKLIRRSGEVVHVDISRFHVTREDRFNPFLLDGDVIQVPTRNLPKNFVTVDGAVHAPNRYEFVEGDDLLTVLAIANGLTVNADSSHVVIKRMDERGNLQEELLFDLRAIRGGESPNPTLHRGDRVLVRAIPDERGRHKVILAGELLASGSYPIGKSGERLSQVVRQAGGFTGHAFLEAAVVLRKEERMSELVDPRLDLIRTLRAYNIPPADSSFFLEDFDVARQPVVVDFVKLFVQQDTTADVMLRDGDIVYVPSVQQTVLVQGQVVNPGFIDFVPGMGVGYYVERTGGYGELAIKGDVKVIKRGSQVWMDPTDTIIEPGDRIWVPKQPRREFEYYLGIVRDVANIITAVTTTILLAIRIAQ
jgi:protein involved in polysaccharide export with SLBB domain